MILMISELSDNILTKYINDENFDQSLKEKQKLIDYEKRKQILIRSEGDKYEFLNLEKQDK